MGNDELRTALIEVLWESGRHGCMTDECSESLACAACRSDLGADVDAILAGFPDGWAKHDGKWFGITSDGVGYGEFDRTGGSDGE